MEIESEVLDVVSENPIVLVISLPDGCKPGRLGAAESFADTLRMVSEMYPEAKFQLLPFTYNANLGRGNPDLTSFLAIES